jgi:serine/threonine protein kinase
VLPSLASFLPYFLPTFLPLYYVLVLNEGMKQYQIENELLDKKNIIYLHGIVKGKITDPYICNTFHIGVGSAAIGLVMENAICGSLHDILYTVPKRFSSMSHKISICAQISKGLAELHAINVVHGDLKPANILLSGDESSFKVMLSDFGFSRKIAHQDQMIGASTLRATNSKGKVGFTPLYTAPEMLTDGNDVEEGFVLPTRASDSYSLGILIWEIILFSSCKLFSCSV